MGDYFYDVQRIPLPVPGLSGSLYRGSMPWGLHTTEGRQEYSQMLNKNSIDKVIVLVTDMEISFASEDQKPDAIEFYKNTKITPIRFPFPDGGVPSNKEEFAQLISNLYLDLSDGQNVLVHCMGGIGRTGLVISCLAKFLLSIQYPGPGNSNNIIGSANEVDSKFVLLYVRNHLPGAVETAQQERFLLDFMSDKTSKEENAVMSKEESDVMFEEESSVMKVRKGMKMRKLDERMPTIDAVSPDKALLR